MLLGVLFFDIVEGGTGDAGAEAVGLAAFRLKANLVSGAAAARNPSRSASIALTFYLFTVSKRKSSSHGLWLPGLDYVGHNWEGMESHR